MNLKAAKGEEVDEQGDWEKKLSMLKNKLAGGIKEIELKQGPEALKLVLEKSLTPLANAWEKKLSSIDPLFLDRKNFISINDEPKFQGNSIPASLKRGIDANGGIVGRPGILLKSFSLSCTFTGLHDHDNNVNIEGGYISIRFFNNAYTISYSTAEKPLNKLYSHPLLEGEINNIIDIIGTWFIKNLELYMDGQKK